MNEKKVIISPEVTGKENWIEGSLIDVIYNYTLDKYKLLVKTAYGTFYTLQDFVKAV